MDEIKNLSHITRSLSVLYVEDDKSARESTFELLSNLFSSIVVATNGQEGLEMFRREYFDLILSDVHMPQLNGIEMVREIRHLNKDIPILLLSAYNENVYLLESIALGVDGYILKPLVYEQFIDALTRVVQIIELKRENDNYKLYLEEEVQKRTDELEKKLHFDDLTLLHNRYSFFEDIKSVDVPVLLIIDINKFKIINEIYGSDNGSLVLQRFASFLADFAKKKGYRVYRLSGDEFILLDIVKEIISEKYEEDIADFFTLMKELSIELDNGDSISIEVTMGISTAQYNAFECAKIALDFAKEHKKDYVMFSSKIDTRNDERDALVWKAKIKESLKHSLVKAVYQPIVNKEGKIIKHETLMRLQERDSDILISPFYFLEISIKTGLYPHLSKFVIFEALNILKNSQHTLSINFTYTDIRDNELLEEIESFIKASPEVGKRAVFEITESESIENYDKMKQFIYRFRKYGVLFAIDDFGSGFSNFEYILEIEPEYLKIDGSLIKEIDNDAKAYILVKAIVEFCHKLGIKTIAEYVHSQKVFEMLRDLEVDEYQGFYFSEPLLEI